VVGWWNNWAIICVITIGSVWQSLAVDILSHCTNSLTLQNRQMLVKISLYCNTSWSLYMRRVLMHINVQFYRLTIRVRTVQPKIRWANVQAIDVRFSQDLTHQKYVNFWQSYLKNRKVGIFFWGGGTQCM